MGRIENTIAFMKATIGENKKILDLGTPNELSQAMKDAGYEVINTGGEDLDIDYAQFADMEVDAITAYEIFEHLLAPYNILRTIKAKHIVTSVPLNLWFASAYWNSKDVWDCHYHEFEQKQFDMLLKRSGWDIQARDKWTNPEYKKIGIRPLLRLFAKRHYIVHATRTPGYTPK
jgi:hypothetical protein